MTIRTVTVTAALDSTKSIAAVEAQFLPLSILQLVRLDTANNDITSTAAGTLYGAKRVVMGQNVVLKLQQGHTAMDSADLAISLNRPQFLSDLQDISIAALGSTALTSVDNTIPKNFSSIPGIVGRSTNTLLDFQATGVSGPTVFGVLTVMGTLAQGETANATFDITPLSSGTNTLVFTEVHPAPAQVLVVGSWEMSGLATMGPSGDLHAYKASTTYNADAPSASAVVTKDDVQTGTQSSSGTITGLGFKSYFCSHIAASNLMAIKTEIAEGGKQARKAAGYGLETSNPTLNAPLVQSVSFTADQLYHRGDVVASIAFSSAGITEL